jgi:hypothetical protein
MNDKTLKILLGIIALNLTVQTLKEVNLIPTSYAQSNDVQRVVLCDPRGRFCGDDWHARSISQKIVLCGPEGLKCGDDWVQFVRQNPPSR